MKDLGINIRALAGTIVLEIYQELYFQDWLVNFLRWQITEYGDEAPMIIRINSVGGDPRTGLALYSLIKNHKGSTTCYIEYMCDSSATLPACGCDTVIGNEFPFEYMIHDPKIDQGWVGVEESQMGTDYLNQIRDDFVRIYQEKTGQAEEKIRAWMKQTKFMNAKEALELGFIDKIEEVSATLEAKIDYQLAAKAYDRPKEFQIEGRGTSPATSNNQQPNIEGSIMEWWKKLTGKWNMGDDADEADVVLKGTELKAEADKVPELQKQVTELTKERDQLQAKVTELTPAEPTAEELEKQSEEAIESELSAAVKDFKISAEAKTQYAEAYKGNVDGLKAALGLIAENTVKPSTSVKPKNVSASAGINPVVSKHFGG
jgi:ATP-dependent protease ClpP protease subunit